MKSKTRILVADDHPLLREALCQALSNQKDMDVVGEDLQIARRGSPDNSLATDFGHTHLNRVWPRSAGTCL